MFPRSLFFIFQCSKCEFHMPADGLHKVYIQVNLSFAECKNLTKEMMHAHLPLVWNENIFPFFFKEGCLRKSFKSFSQYLEGLLKIMLWSYFFFAFIFAFPEIQISVIIKHPWMEIFYIAIDLGAWEKIDHQPDWT